MCFVLVTKMADKTDIFMKSDSVSFQVLSKMLKYSRSGFSLLTHMLIHRSPLTGFEEVRDVTPKIKYGSSYYFTATCNACCISLQEMQHEVK